MLDQFRAQKLEWNRANNQIYDRVETSSGDSNGRTLFVQISNGGTVEDLTGATLSLAWSKRIEQGLETFEEVDAKKGQYRLFYPTGMLVNHGVLQASLVLVDVTGRIESKPFDIIVHKGTVDDEAVESDNKFTALTTALVKVSQVQAEFDGLYADKSQMMDTLKVEKSNEMDQLYDDKNQALTGLESDFADKAENLETTYAPRLTSAEQDITTNHQEVTAQLAQTANDLLNIKAEGAVGDGVADDTLAIRSAISKSGGKIYIPKGTYKITGTINLPTQAVVKGVGVNDAHIKCASNDFDAFSFSDGAYRVNVSGFRLSSTVGASNSGFKTGDNGFQEGTFEDLVIWNFCYGFKSKELFWMNTIKNVRFNLCSYGFYNDGVEGGSLVNKFDHVYFDRSEKVGAFIQAMKNTEFSNCNFGGRKGGDNAATVALRLNLNSFGTRMTATNIEHHIDDGMGIIQTWSGSQLEMDTTSIFNCDGPDAGNGYAIVTRENSRVNVINCFSLQIGANLRGIYNINNSTVHINASDVFFDDIVSYSSIPPVLTSRLFKLYDDSSKIVTASLNQRAVPNAIQTGVVVSELDVAADGINLVSGAVRLDKGVYDVVANIRFEVNATGDRSVNLGMFTQTVPATSSESSITIGNMIKVAVDNTPLPLTVFQSSGGNLNLLSTSKIKIRKVAY